MYDLYGSLGNLAILKNRKSRAINAENPTGEKVKAGWHQAIWDLQEKEVRV